MRQQKQNAEIKPASSLQRRASGDSILVVDDDPVTLALLNKILQAEYSVVMAANGKIAVQKLQQEKISLIISDIQMPEMNGWELLALLQQNREFAHIPVIIVTSEGNQESKIRALRLGAMDILHKPFVPEILNARVKNLLVKQQAARATEENRMYRQMLRQQAQNLWGAEHDMLTGLYNR